MAIIDDVSIDVGDSSFRTFKSVSINESLDFFGKAFNIEINIPAQDADVFFEGQGIKIYLDDEVFLTGYIEQVSINYSSNTCDVNISGRDKVCDLIDSRVSNKVFATPTSFENVLRKTLEAVGYEVVSANKLGNSISNIAIPSLSKQGFALTENQIAIVNEYGYIEPFSNTEGIGFSKDEGAYNLIQRLADKRRLVLGTDANGNILIRKIGDKQSYVKLQNLVEISKNNFLGASAAIDTSQNNIKDASIKRDLKNLYYEYKILSSSTAVASNSNAGKNDRLSSINNLTTQYSGVFYDESIRKTRKFYDYIAGLNNEQCKERAKWECNIRKSKSFEYSCKVVGWKQGLKPTTLTSISLDNLTKKDELWQVNQLVQITDNLAQINDNLLIKDITYNLNNQEGSFVNLTCVDKLSYTNSVFEPKIKRTRKNKNNSITKQSALQ